MLKNKNAKSKTFNFGDLLLASGGVLILASGIVACTTSSSPSSPGATTTPTITSAAGGIAAATASLKNSVPSVAAASLTAFNSKAPHRGGLYDIMGMVFPIAKATSYTSFGVNWGTTATIPSLYGSSNTTIQNYIWQTLDPNFVNNNGSYTGISGRYNSALFQSCIMLAFLTPASACGTDTDGLPKVGTCSPTIPVSGLTAGSSFNGCTVPTSMAGSSGTLSLSATVTAVTGNANYTKKIVILGAPVGAGTGTITVYIKLDSANNIFNIESISPGDNITDSPLCGGSRYIMAINNNVTQFEYTSLTLGSDVLSGCSPDRNSNPNTTSHEDFYRIHVDTGSNVAYMLGSEPQKGSVQGETFLLSGAPTKIAANAGSIGVSVWVNQYASIPSTGASASYNEASADACVSQSAGSVTTDGTLSCDITGLDVASATTLLSTTTTNDFQTPTAIKASPAPSAISWTNAADFVTAVTN